MDMWQDKNDKIHVLALLKAQAEITLDQIAMTPVFVKSKVSTSMIPGLKDQSGWRTLVP